MTKLITFYSNTTQRHAIHPSRTRQLIHLKLSKVPIPAAHNSPDDLNANSMQISHVMMKFQYSQRSSMPFECTS
jgi:hypothetical protein